MIGQYRFQRFVCSGRVDLTVRVELVESSEFSFRCNDTIDQDTQRFLLAGVREALIESENSQMAATLVSFQNDGEGENCGAIKTAAKAAANDALGLRHLLPATPSQ